MHPSRRFYYNSGKDLSMFIKLHRQNLYSDVIWVNMNNVLHVEKSTNGGAWLLFNDEITIQVKQSPEEIFSVISYFAC